MSSDEEVGEVDEIVDNIDENNEILETGEDLGEDIQEAEEITEEVQRDETADGDAEGGDGTTVKPKRVIRNPRPKLNEETLKGPRGLAALPTYFERVKFKGKGYEKQDLNTIMKTYEYWCHRLFPKYPFDTCIEKIENLGKKKAVQTHIKRIRFDLFVEDTPIIDSSDEETNVDGFVDITNEQINQQNQAFNQILPSANQAAPVELTDEQNERIRLNKERAEKLRAERLRKATEKAEENLEVSSQLPSTSGLNLGEDDMESVGDVLSQKETEDAPKFDLESNVKGKARVGGITVKKKGSTREENKENIENDASMDAEEFQNGENSSDNTVLHKKKKLNRIVNNDDGDSVGSKSVENDVGNDFMHVEDSNDNSACQKNTRESNGLVDSDEEDSIQSSNIENEASRDGEDTNDNLFLQKNSKKFSRILDSDEEDSNQASNTAESSNDSVKILTRKSNGLADSDDNETLRVSEADVGEDQIEPFQKKAKSIVSDEDSNGSDALNTSAKTNQNGLDVKSGTVPNSLGRRRKPIIESDESDQEMEVI